MRVEWSEPALQDLENLRDYIAKDSPVYAQQFIEKIFEAVTRLTTFPELGRLVPEADRPDVRELIFHSYRIIYCLKNDAVFIVTVLHGSRDLAQFEKKPWQIK